MMCSFSFWANTDAAVTAFCVMNVHVAYSEFLTCFSLEMRAHTRTVSQPTNSIYEIQFAFCVSFVLLCFFFSFCKHKIVIVVFNGPLSLSQCQCTATEHCSRSCVASTFHNSNDKLVLIFIQKRSKQRHTHTRSIWPHHSNQSCETLLIVCDTFAFHYYYWVYLAVWFLSSFSGRIFSVFDLHEVNCRTRCFSRDNSIFLVCLVSYSFMNFCFCFEARLNELRFVCCVLQFGFEIFSSFFGLSFIGQKATKENAAKILSAPKLIPFERWTKQQKMYTTYFVWSYEKKNKSFMSLNACDFFWGTKGQKKRKQCVYEMDFVSIQECTARAATANNRRYIDYPKCHVAVDCFWCTIAERDHNQHESVITSHLCMFRWLSNLDVCQFRFYDKKFVVDFSPRALSARTSFSSKILIENRSIFNDHQRLYRRYFSKYHFQYVWTKPID